MKKTTSRTMTILIIMLIAAGLVAAFMPRPVLVDVAEVAQGPMRITIDEEGRTRIRERYIVSAPLAGQVQRIRLRAGDPVVAGDTILTTILPGDPALLDARAVAEAEAKVRRAESALHQAAPARHEAKVRLDFAETELGRIREAFDRRAATPTEMDSALMTYRIAFEAHNAALFAEEIARFELELAKAALLRTRPEASEAERAEFLIITAPVNGQVLRVFQESMAVVTPGTPLLEIGDATDLEVEIDVLSADAVRIVPGAKVTFEHWGGPNVLHGRVRLVEPRARTRISSLGVEEQRVYVIADFTDPPDLRTSLGDGYRVEAAVIIWESDNAVRVPVGALLRTGESWGVFIIENGRARLRTIEIGRRGALAAEVQGGLRPGDLVVMHPDDQVREGVRLRVR